MEMIECQNCKFIFNKLEIIRSLIEIEDFFVLNCPKCGHTTFKDIDEVN